MCGFREKCSCWKHFNKAAAENHLGVGVNKRPGDSVTIMNEAEQGGFAALFNQGGTAGKDSSSLVVSV